MRLGILFTWKLLYVIVIIFLVEFITLVWFILLRFCYFGEEPADVKPIISVIIDLAGSGYLLPVYCPLLHNWLITIEHIHLFIYKYPINTFEKKMGKSFSQVYICNFVNLSHIYYFMDVTKVPLF